MRAGGVGRGVSYCRKPESRNATGQSITGFPALHESTGKSSPYSWQRGDADKTRFPAHELGAKFQHPDEIATVVSSKNTVRASRSPGSLSPPPPKPSS